MTEDWVEVRDGVLLFALDAGPPDGPLVVLLHGITAHAYVWRPVIDDLAGEFRVVAVDQRGHGRSRVPSGVGYASADFASDVAGLIGALGAGSAIVVGHSLGGRNAVVVAGRYPELVSGLVSVEYSPFVESTVIDEVVDRMAGHPTTFPDEAALYAHLRQRYPLLPEDALERRARYGFRDDGDRWVPVVDHAVMAETAEGLREDVRGLAERVSCPAVYCRGEASSFISKAAWRATAELPGAPLLLSVEGADHFVPEEHPSHVASAVRRVALSVDPLRRS